MPRGGPAAISQQRPVGRRLPRQPRGIGDPPACTDAGLDSTPVTIAGLADIVDVSVGSAHACAVTGGGDVYCWGDNPVGLIDPTGPAAITTPTRIRDLTRSVP